MNVGYPRLSNNTMVGLQILQQQQQTQFYINFIVLLIYHYWKPRRGYQAIACLTADDVR